MDGELQTFRTRRAAMRPRYARSLHDVCFHTQPPPLQLSSPLCSTPLFLRFNFPAATLMALLLRASRFERSGEPEREMVVHPRSPPPRCLT